MRCAHHNGLKVQTFCDRVFGKEHQVWNRDVDRLAPPWLLQVITVGTGVSPHLADNTTMKLFEGRLFEHRNRGGQLRWVLLLGQYHRLHQGFGMQYCPLCLGEDSEPYYRLSWRLAFYTFCPRHQTLLLDRCHACGAPVAFHRIELGRPGRYDTPSLVPGQIEWRSAVGAGEMASGGVPALGALAECGGSPVRKLGAYRLRLHGASARDLPSDSIGAQVPRAAAQPLPTQRPAGAAAESEPEAV